MQSIFAIAWLTWKAALRFKLFLVIAVLLIGAVVGLPLVIKDDGTAQGFTQIILTYTLGAITLLLGISTLWLSCGTLARDVEECQMQVVATKPVARWQIWVGKWLGIMSLNAVLLAVTGACVGGLLVWRSHKLPPDQQKILREQVLVARGSAKPPDMRAEIDQKTEIILQGRLKNSPVDKVDVPEVRRQIREGVKADYQLALPSYFYIWKIDLGHAQNRLRGQPLRLRVKFNTPQLTASGTTYLALWLVGDPPKWQSEPMSLAPDTFHEFQIPPDLFDAQGILTVAFVNQNNTALLFPLNESMEVLYPQGGFALNFVRGLLIIWFWMGMVAALGLMAASYLSFPVASFFSMAIMLVFLSSGMLAETVESGSVAAGAEEGQAGHSVADVVLIPAFKGVIAVVGLATHHSPIAALSSGRSITWGELGLAFLEIVVLFAGLMSLVGIILFSRRELATAQGTQ